ncbi:hypothetical protein BV22DRAFT_1061820 [Leucogyrophana mollusca]|uniref:Uncharacterized protein n=1 Tax=Leucogyrophana mollusca TaxID=85980 RepID=A0ACB8BPB4_9AGAM|nr:hypothetical protein BV22DRAFT_1061820 [Leucogyrophana mollusca]
MTGNEYHFELGESCKQGICDRKMIFCNLHQSDYHRDDPKDHVTECPTCSRFRVVCLDCDKQQNIHQYRLVYVDGSCLGNGRAGARSGIGVAMGVHGENMDQWSIPIDDNVDPFEQRNNTRAEILAVLTGIQKLGEDTRASAASEQAYHRCPCVNGNDSPLRWVIATDSDFVMKGMTEWMPAWKQSAAGAEDKPGVPCCETIFELFQKVDKEMTFWERELGVEIGFWCISRDFNELADSLAKRGARAASAATSISSGWAE